MSKTPYTLQYPITIDGKEVRDVHLRRVLVQDLENIDDKDNNIQTSIKLISSLSGINPEDVRLMDASDFQALDDIVTGFLE